MHDTSELASSPAPPSSGARRWTERRRHAAVARAVARSTVVGLVAVLGGCGILWGGFSRYHTQEASTSHGAQNATAESTPPTDVVSIVSGQLIETPCWSYDGPRTFVNNISPDQVNLCHGALELWGEDMGGVVVPTGFGAILGQVSVEPVRVSTSES